MNRLSCAGNYIDIVGTIIENPVRHSTNSRTIGGNNEEVFKSQYLEMELRGAVKASQLITLNSIITDMTDELFLTPDRALIGKSAAERMKVVISNVYEIDERVKWIDSQQIDAFLAGEEGYFFTMELTEVLY